MLKTTFFYNLPTLEGEITDQRIQSILNATYAREDRIQEEGKDRKQECVYTCGECVFSRLTRLCWKPAGWTEVGERTAKNPTDWLYCGKFQTYTSTFDLLWMF